MGQPTRLLRWLEAVTRTGCDMAWTLEDTLSIPPGQRGDNDWFIMTTSNPARIHALRLVTVIPFTIGILGYSNWVQTLFTESVFLPSQPIPALTDSFALVTQPYILRNSTTGLPFSGFLAIHLAAYIQGVTLELHSVTNVEYLFRE